ncbi:hypothetical protein JOB18_009671 [Solea senegalensis]|uniref:Secreted protein n=1 Tax=Solea senegalensis TaxID=28829 RepID=A0AAV6SXN7_SOLSE|nr:hypothetical protein JOB18_009671 [Solea senegalensis]
MLNMCLVLVLHRWIWINDWFCWLTLSRRSPHEVLCEAECRSYKVLDLKQACKRLNGGGGEEGGTGRLSLTSSTAKGYLWVNVPKAL